MTHKKQSLAAPGHLFRLHEALPVRVPSGTSEPSHPEIRALAELSLFYRRHMFRRQVGDPGPLVFSVSQQFPFPFKLNGHLD